MIPLSFFASFRLPDPGFCDLMSLHDGMIQRVGGFVVGGGKDAGTTQFLESSHPFEYDRFAQSTFPMLGCGAYQHCHGTAGVVIEIDRAEGCNAVIGCGGDNIEVAAIEWG